MDTEQELLDQLQSLGKRLIAYGREAAADDLRKEIDAVLAPKPKPVRPLPRLRAPKGLGALMVENALGWPSAKTKGVTSAEIHRAASTPEEKMVSVVVLRKELSSARAQGRCTFKEGRWYPKQ